MLAFSSRKRRRSVETTCEIAADGSWSARCVAGLSYGSHTVGFTPPATLSRAAISHYNTPALHVHGGSSHAVAVSTTHASRQTLGDRTADFSHKKISSECETKYAVQDASDWFCHTGLQLMKCPVFSFSLSGVFNSFICIAPSSCAAFQIGLLFSLFRWINFCWLNEYSGATWRNPDWGVRFLLTLKQRWATVVLALIKMLHHILSLHQSWWCVW